MLKTMFTYHEFLDSPHRILFHLRDSNITLYESDKYGFVKETGVSFESLQGQTFTHIERQDAAHIQYIEFCNEDTCIVQAHFQQCCERVYLDDIVGDLEDLQGMPILLAEETCSTKDTSPLWTFYKLAGLKGFATLRWCAGNDSMYSESVDHAKFKQISRKEYKKLAATRKKT